MNPQTVAEGKRILAVVDDLIEDLCVLAYVPPYLSAIPTQDLQHITNTFEGTHGAREAQMQLTEHYDVERRIESAAGDLSADDITDHHLSTRALIDTLRLAKYGSGGYRAAFPCNAQIMNYRSILLTLRSLLNDRFNTTVEDDVVKFAILNDTVNREKTASADVQALNREYQNEKESRRVEVEKRNAAIRKLREEIETLREASQNELQNFEKVSAEHRQSDQERYESELQDLENKLNELEHDLGQVESKCGRAEMELRQTRNKKEAMLQQIIDTYDTQMTSSTETINELQKAIDTDGDQLRQVEQQLDVYNTEANEYETECKIEEQRKTHRVLITQEMERNAMVIQAMYRSYAARLHQTQKGKGKKKGKKKD